MWIYKAQQIHKVLKAQYKINLHYNIYSIIYK